MEHNDTAATPFDYSKAIGELEAIAAKVEDPSTRLDDVDKLIGRSRELIKGCRDYLRGVRERIDRLEENRP